MTDESAQERAVRVLFSHMNALLFAERHFLQVNEDLNLGKRSALADAVKDMLSRFERLGPSGPEANNDKEFGEAMKIFAGTYADRSEKLVADIEVLAGELAKPSMTTTAGAAIKNSVQWLVELIVTTTVQTTVQAAIEGA